VILLLDSHALLWWLAKSPELRDSAATSIADPANEVVVSAASIWEIEIKRAKGKLRPPEALLDAIQAEGFSTLAITGSDAVRAAGLPDHHADPFDRVLVAQALRLDATIVSRDPALPAYGVDVLPT